MKADGGRRKAEGAARAARVTRHGSRGAFQALAIALTVPLALLLGGCDYLPFGYTSINEIIAAPANFEGKDVKVKGRVTGSVRVLGMSGFTLRDDSGEIAVSTTGALPAVGSEAALRGTVKSAAIIGGSAMGLRVEETKRLR